MPPGHRFLCRLQYPEVDRTGRRSWYFAPGKAGHNHIQESIGRSALQPVLWSMTDTDRMRVDAGHWLGRSGHCTDAASVGEFGRPVGDMADVG
jgi:hypothetical protein